MSDAVGPDAAADTAPADRTVHLPRPPERDPNSGSGPTRPDDPLGTELNRNTRQRSDPRPASSTYPPRRHVLAGDDPIDAAPGRSAPPSARRSGRMLPAGIPADVARARERAERRSAILALGLAAAITLAVTAAGVAGLVLLAH